MTRSLRRFGLAAMTAAAALALLSGAGMADDEVEVSVAIKDHVFQPAEIKVPAGKAIVLSIDNQDATAEEFESHQLHIEKIIPGQSKGMVHIRALEPGSYAFVGEFNEDTAKGVIVAE